MTQKRRLIRQFMWGYQPHFRISTRTGVEMAFAAIGFKGNPKVLLVGFQVAGEHEFDICVEPEDGPYSPPDFAEVTARAKVLYE